MEDVPFYQTTDLSVGKQVGITNQGFVLTRNYPGKVPGARGEAAFLDRPVRPPLRLTRAHVASCLRCLPLMRKPSASQLYAHSMSAR